MGPDVSALATKEVDGASLAKLSVVIRASGRLEVIICVSDATLR